MTELQHFRLVLASDTGLQSRDPGFESRNSLWVVGPLKPERSSLPKPHPKPLRKWTAGFILYRNKTFQFMRLIFIIIVIYGKSCLQSAIWYFPLIYGSHYYLCLWITIGKELVIVTT